MFGSMMMRSFMKLIVYLNWK